MAEPVVIDLFVEDRAHEAFVGELVQRLVGERGCESILRARCARGGHGRAISELGLYQRAVEEGFAGLSLPSILVVAIDANCQRLQDARRSIQDSLASGFEELTAIACPDPHVERWYVADPPSFRTVVGVAPRTVKRKCERAYYKNILEQAVRRAGHAPTLGGIEFAREIVQAMDLGRVANAERSLATFLGDLRALLARATA